MGEGGYIHPPPPPMTVTILLSPGASVPGESLLDINTFPGLPLGIPLWFPSSLLHRYPGIHEARSGRGSLVQFTTFSHCLHTPHLQTYYKLYLKQSTKADLKLTSKFRSAGNPKVLHSIVNLACCLPQSPPTHHYFPKCSYFSSTWTAQTEVDFTVSIPTWTCPVDWLIT